MTSYFVYDSELQNKSVGAFFLVIRYALADDLGNMHLQWGWGVANVIKELFTRTSYSIVPAKVGIENKPVGYKKWIKREVLPMIRAIIQTARGQKDKLRYELKQY